MSGELNIREENTGEAVTVFLSGEVDIYSAQSLKERLYALADSIKSDLRIDCTELNYIDSTGLGIFVGALKKTKQYGGKIYIKNLKDSIKKLFLITGLDKVFIIEE